MTKGSIFERYGGFAAAGRIVMSFYGRVLDSDVTGPFFDDIDMARLVDHQTKFVASIMGGPAAYTDEALRQLHGHLGITGEAFDEMADLFRKTLEDFGMAEADIETLDREIRARRKIIVGEAQ